MLEGLRRLLGGLQGLLGSFGEAVEPHGVEFNLLLGDSPDCIPATPAA
jgi:hypothetical protein